MNADEPSFEEVFRGLHETIVILEQGGLPLQEAIEHFERGMQLANRCAAILDGAELQVTRLLESSHLGGDEPAF